MCKFMHSMYTCTCTQFFKHLVLIELSLPKISMNHEYAVNSSNSLGWVDFSFFLNYVSCIESNVMHCPLRWIPSSYHHISYDLNTEPWMSKRLSERLSDCTDRTQTFISWVQRPVIFFYISILFLQDPLLSPLSPPTRIHLPKVSPSTLLSSFFI